MPDDAPPSFATVPLFAGADADTLRDLDAASETLELAAGAPLFAQGDPGDAMYLLVEGRLDVRLTQAGQATSIDVLEPPALLGETALLTGRPRSAGIVALTPSRLLRLPADAFERLADRHPELLQRLDAHIRPRLRRTQVAPLLRAWFGADDAAEVARLQDELDWVELHGGETLFHQGDASDAMYLVVAGRLRLERDDEDGRHVVGEVGPDESTGDASMLLGQARSASARALRDSRLVRVPAEVAERHPGVMARLARTVALRAQRASAGRGRGRPPRTFALIAADPELDLRDLAQALLDGLADEGGGRIVGRTEVEDAFGRAERADARRGEAAGAVLADWLDRLEREHERLVYLTDPGATPWNERCLRQADRILVVGRGDRPDASARLAETVRGLAPDTPLELLRLRPDDQERPTGTAAWLDALRPDRHHQLRRGDALEVRSAARRIAGRGRILVLSGGGARGYVHIGLLHAIEAAGIEIDAVAGTSMGALVGAGYALSRSATYADASARTFGDPDRLVDRTLPLLALARTRGVTTALQEILGDALIEDLPLPFFCVAADLGRALPHLFDRGPLWRAVRGSSAIPGVFAPILVDDSVIVDGGVMNNFPVDLARERFGDGPMIASNAYGHERPRKHYDFPDEVSGWALLRQRLLPRSRRRIQAPTILSVLTQATSLNSHYRMDLVASGADLVVRYPTDDVGSLEFERVDELVAMGRERGRAALADWRPTPA